MAVSKYVPTPVKSGNPKFLDAEFVKIKDSINGLNDFVTPLVQSVLDFQGQYNSFFNSGYVAWVGPGGTLNFSGQLVFGTNIPNPTGINAPALLIGGAGQPRACLLTDEQINGQKGIDLIIAAGNVGNSPTNADTGGDLLMFGGGALLGPGGAIKVQGGTSVNSIPGATTIHGGNGTGAGAQRGDVDIIGGELGTNGGRIRLTMTYGTGTDGQILIQSANTAGGTNLLWTITRQGSVIFGAGGQSVGDVLVSAGVTALPVWTTKEKTAAKTAATSRTSTTAPANDPDLVVTGVPVGNYQLEAFMGFGGSGVGGFKARVVLPGGITGNFGVHGFTNGAVIASGALVGNTDLSINALAGADIANGGANLVATGNASQTTGGTVWKKTGGSVAFDSAVYCTVGSNNCRIRATPHSLTERSIFGLSTNAAALNTENINYSIFFNNTPEAFIFESGAAIVSIGAFVVTDVFEITYDNVSVRYIKNGVVVRTVAVAGLTLAADSSFLDPAAQLDNVHFTTLAAGSDQWVKFDGVVVVGTAGTVQLAWSQAVSDPINTTVFNGYLTLRKL
jgi:hypothetical protein